jgi:hypothetical protein
MDRIARKVAARWSLRVAMSGWNPPIPEWVFRFGAKEAFAPSPGDHDTFELARESVHLMLPTLLGLFRKRLGDRYSMNASQRGLDLFFYFTTPHPIDSIVLHLGVKNGRVQIELRYVPFRLSTSLPDFTKSVGVGEWCDDPEMVGLHVMRMARKVLDKVA